jgi:hypothetical protein
MDSQHVYMETGGRDRTAPADALVASAVPTDCTFAEEGVPHSRR